MKRALGILLFLSVPAAAQQAESPNVVVVTLDGLRWQELFRGADSMILFQKKSGIPPETIQQFWHTEVIKRRTKLMPYMWSTIAAQGQLLGNRDFDNEVDCDNPYWFSYPGYSEMLTGIVDRRVDSNKKIENPNATVFELIEKHPNYTGKVAVFGTWNVIESVFRSGVSGIPTNCGNGKAVGDNLSTKEEWLNELSELLPTMASERPDVFTVLYALEYMTRLHPKLVFIGLDETDAFGHQGRYDQYLAAAHRSDMLVKKIWTFVEADPFYQDNTTIIITTDHGRGKFAGKGKLGWSNHGRLSLGSGQVWIGAIGPQIEPLGEISKRGSHQLSQIAATVADICGVKVNSGMAVKIESLSPTGSIMATSFTLNEPWRPSRGTDQSNVFQP